MPLCTLHLLSLHPQTTTKQFLNALKSYNIHPLTTSKVIRWIITPEKINTKPLLSPPHPYDLLLITQDTNPLPGPLEAKTSAYFSLQVGVPSRLLKDFQSKNRKLLHPDPSSVPSLTGALDNPLVDPKSSQTLALSPDLRTWIDEFKDTRAGRNAVSMLNLLAFHPDKKASYLEYGKAFAATIGSKRGGDAKLVGHVVYPNQSPSSSASAKEVRWDEFALAHYPSITHFADMLASEDYQSVNRKYRVPALRDTCILCTSEIEVEDLMEAANGKAKL